MEAEDSEGTIVEDGEREKWHLVRISKARFGTVLIFSHACHIATTLYAGSMYQTAGTIVSFSNKRFVSDLARPARSD